MSLVSLIPPMLAGLLLLVTSIYGDATSPRWRSVVLLTTLVLMVRYHAWRIAVTLPMPVLDGAVIAIYLFYAIEALSAYNGHKQLLSLRHIVGRSVEADQREGWFERGGAEPPLIDVCIATYNENERILRRTLVGTAALQYPRYRVWVLDDGRREWVRALAEKYNAGYITRPSNEHYKAGNLNNAYEYLMSLPEPPEFIAVFDADFIARRNFLRRSLTLLEDPQVACVQTPQVFYNPDPFQFAFAGVSFWPDAQRSWFAHHLKCLDAVGAATCCGTSFLVRASAVAEIGGIPTEALSEDTLMSIKMRHKGLKTVFLDEPLSVGLAPEGIAEFLTQRGRWCLGSIQILMGKWGPLSRYRGILKFWKALHFFGWTRMAILRQLWLLLPIVWWLGEVSLIQAEDADIVSYMLPLLVMRGADRWLSRSATIPTISDSAELIEAFAVIKATWQGVKAPVNQPFKVTDKGVSRSHIIVHWNPLLWYLFLLCLLLFGMAYQLVGPGRNSGSGDFRLWMMYFSSVEVALLFITCVACVEFPRYRLSERYALNRCTRAQVAGVGSSVVVLDISEDGAKLQLERPPPPGTRIDLALDELGTLRGTVVRAAAANAVGIRFDPDQRDHLIRSLYCENDYVYPAQSWSALKCWGAVVRKIW